jgi:hypothetical protein
MRSFSRKEVWMKTRKKLPDLFVESCAECPHVQVLLGAGHVTVGCGLNLLRGRKEWEIFVEPTVMGTIHEDKVMRELHENVGDIPAWCPLEDA